MQSTKIPVLPLQHSNAIASSLTKYIEMLMLYLSKLCFSGEHVQYIARCSVSCTWAEYLQRCIFSYCELWLWHTHTSYPLVHAAAAALSIRFGWHINRMWHKPLKLMGFIAQHFSCLVWKLNWTLLGSAAQQNIA